MAFWLSEDFLLSLDLGADCSDGAVWMGSSRSAMVGSSSWVTKGMLFDMVERARGLWFGKE